MFFTGKIKKAADTLPLKWVQAHPDTQYTQILQIAMAGTGTSRECIYQFFSAVGEITGQFSDLIRSTRIRTRRKKGDEW